MMISYRTQRLLLLAKFFRTQNASSRLNALSSFSTKARSTNNQVPKYLALLGFGAASYYLFDHFRSSKKQVDTGLAQTEPSIELDLNEIYEKTAVVFLSNPEVNLF